MDEHDEHAAAVHRVSLAIAVSIFAGILIGSWVSHRVGRRWTEAVDLLRDLDETIVQVRADVRRRMTDASDVGELTAIALDAVQQQRERRHHGDGV